MNTKTKKQFKELSEIDSLVANIYEREPNLRQTKFGYAYKRFVEKNYIPLINKFQEELSVIRLDHALEDPTTKAVLFDSANSRGYKYSREGLKQVIIAENRAKEEFYDREFEVEPFIVKEIPKELTKEEVEQLKGIVF